MKKPKWVKLSSKVLVNHPRIKVVEDIIKLPNGYETEYVKIVNTHDGVSVICINEDKVLLQKEYSYPLNKILYQFPGGGVEHRENVLVAAKRELGEEEGLDAKNYTEIGWYYLQNRRSKAKMHVVVAEDTFESVKIGGDAEEEIESEWVEIEKVERMIAEGKILNGSLLSVWTVFKAKINRL